MIKNTLFICLTLFNFCLRSQNFTAVYGFADLDNTSGTIDPSIVPVVQGLTFGAFNAIGVSGNPSASGRFSYNGWPLGGLNNSDNPGDFAGNLSPFAFYKVTLTVVPGSTLSLNSIAFDVRRSGTGIRNYCVRSDRDNFTTNLAASTGTNSKLSVIPNDVFFWNYDSISTAGDQKGSRVNLGDEFTIITNTVSFHFYAWNSESNGGSFSIDNVTFNGSVIDSAGAANIMGIQKISNAGFLSISPNPSRDAVFNLESTSGLIGIEVVCALGKIVKTYSYESAITKTQLKLSDLPEGIYFLRISTNQGRVSKKLILSSSGY